MIKNAIREPISYPSRPASCVADWNFGVQRTIPYANLATNGDFSNGTTGWNLSGGGGNTIAINNGKLRVARTTGLLGTNQSLAYTSGHKYYVKANGVATDMSDFYVYLSTFTRLDNVGYRAIITPSANGTDISFGRLVYNDGTYFEVSTFSAIDLTATFGASNEPSLAWCDANLPFTATSGTCPDIHGGTVYDDTCLESYRDYTNIVNGGDFQSTTAWTNAAGTTVASNNTLKCTAVGAGAYMTQSATHVNGHIYYIRFKYFIEAYTAGTLFAQIGNLAVVVTDLTLNTWISLSGIGTQTSGGAFGTNHIGAVSGTSISYYDDYICIDLTAMFGAGNEPSLTECDALFPFVATTGKARYTHKGTVSGATQVGLSRYFDAVDDYGWVNNSPLLDVQSAPLSCAVIFKIPTGSSSGMIYGKSTALNNTQFGIYWNATNPHIDIYLNGSVVASSANNSAPVDTILEASFILNDGKVQCYINARASGSSAAFTDALVSRSDILFGKVATTYTKMFMYGANQYQGNTFNADEILAHRRQKMAEVGIPT